MQCGTGWTLVTVDQIVNQGETVLYSLTFFSDAGEGEARIYEGMDATSGRQIVPMIEADRFIPQASWDPPLRLERGLFVDMGSKMDAVLVQWDPIVGGRLPGQRET